MQRLGCSYHPASDDVDRLCFKGPNKNSSHTRKSNFEAREGPYGCLKSLSYEYIPIERSIASLARYGVASGG